MPTMRGEQADRLWAAGIASSNNRLFTSRFLRRPDTVVGSRLPRRRGGAGAALTPSSGTSVTFTPGPYTVMEPSTGTGDLEPASIEPASIEPASFEPPSKPAPAEVTPTEVQPSMVA